MSGESGRPRVSGDYGRENRRSHRHTTPTSLRPPYAFLLTDDDDEEMRVSIADQDDVDKAMLDYISSCLESPPSIPFTPIFYHQSIYPIFVAQSNHHDATLPPTAPTSTKSV